MNGPTSVMLLGIHLSLGCAGVSGGDPDGASGAGGERAERDPPERACSLGADTEKCDSAADLACFPVLNDAAGSCARDADCDPGHLCFERDEQDLPGDSSVGVCRSVSGTCQPACGLDQQCAGSSMGEYCNPRSGQCQKKPAKGGDFGDPCDPERDACRGTCVVVGQNSECEERCRIGAPEGCGVESYRGTGVACAFFAYDLADFGVVQGDGDVGICAHLCDCNDDCPGAQLCLPRPTEAYRGICTGGLSIEKSLECSLGGGGARN